MPLNGKTGAGKKVAFRPCALAGKSKFPYVLATTVAEAVAGVGS